MIPRVQRRLRGRRTREIEVLADREVRRVVDAGVEAEGAEDAVDVTTSLISLEIM